MRLTDQLIHMRLTYQLIHMNPIYKPYRSTNPYEAYRLLIHIPFTGEQNEKIVKLLATITYCIFHCIMESQPIPECKLHLQWASHNAGSFTLVLVMHVHPSGRTCLDIPSFFKRQLRIKNRTIGQYHP